jgi:hypothetical protein
MQPSHVHEGVCVPCFTAQHLEISISPSHLYKSNTESARSFRYISGEEDSYIRRIKNWIMLSTVVSVTHQSKTRETHVAPMDTCASKAIIVSPNHRRMRRSVEPYEQYDIPTFMQL